MTVLMQTQIWADVERSQTHCPPTINFVRHQIQTSVLCLSALFDSRGLSRPWMCSHDIKSAFSTGKSTCTCLRYSAQNLFPLLTPPWQKRNVENWDWCLNADWCLNSWAEMSFWTWGVNMVVKGHQNNSDGAQHELPQCRERHKPAETDTSFLFILSGL